MGGLKLKYGIFIFKVVKFNNDSKTKMLTCNAEDISCRTVLCMGIKTRGFSYL